MNKVKLFLITLSLFFLSPLAHAAFQNNGDGTITDTTTNLMWQRCTAPSQEINCAVTPLLYTWDDALAYCNALTLGGHVNWRVPNIKVLHSILDAAKTTAPTIDTAIFSDTEAASYWSSTTLTGTGSMAWYVDFSIGLVMTSPVSKQDPQYLLCVR